MRTSLTILIFLITGIITTNAQPVKHRYGFEANQFLVQSGFGSGTELQVNLTDNKRRTLSLGLYFDSKLHNIGGFSISTQRMLRKYRRNYIPVFEPFVFYNLIYHKTRIDQQMASEDYLIAKGTYKSIEHHTGLGLRINIATGFYLKGEAGFGFYLGSIMKPSKPDPMLNESFGTHGAGALFKIGIGTSF
ncbi:MAG: hypothetical protein JXB00_18455 [Bacteroidales bacterium]|nr:hypothetical protein [Bacteroidales bacterium]